MLGELTTGAFITLSSALTGLPFPFLARGVLRSRRSAAPADSAATIWRRNASRELASAADARDTACVIRTPAPRSAKAARKASAFFSEGVGMARS